jgi:hypothetical protein
VSSPASSGPAGPHFEGQVGDYYLLALLAGSEARGLPGCTVDRVRLHSDMEGERQAILWQKWSLREAPGSPIGFAM